MKSLGWISIHFTKISSVVPTNKFTDAEIPAKKRKTGQKRFHKLHLEFLTFAPWNGKHVVEGKALVEDSKLPAVDGEDGELQPNDDMNGKHVVDGKIPVEDSKLPAVNGEDGELQPNDDMKQASRPEAYCINDDDDDTITDDGLGSE